MMKLLQIMKQVPSRFLIAALPLALAAFVEYLERGSFQDMYTWCAHHTGAAFMAYLITGSIYVLLTAITGRSRLSFLDTVRLPAAPCSHKRK
ncbi:hypothetical protein [Paenibacillus hexagrammi]|uniref:Uncharacterized protein n=1 Tax=Paenibacillus hexagrammi TaxID=2908839 RepID=A0ABY3SDS1_9BACL|nr:hypothetical protein [Paenibacillus sp. YPD9-1]UJF31281.1 hypothetical protein L0M14_15550 [Paenibacillus sp. YPD9-1]